MRCCSACGAFCFRHHDILAGFQPHHPLFQLVKFSFERLHRLAMLALESEKPVGSTQKADKVANRMLRCVETRKNPVYTGLSLG